MVEKRRMSSPGERWLDALRLIVFVTLMAWLVSMTVTLDPGRNRDDQSPVQTPTRLIECEATQC